jgi:hypothetical protein
MKKTIVILISLFISIKAFPQNHLVTLGGGYSYAKISDSDIDVEGWRINGIYEFAKKDGVLSNGVTISYISLSGSGVLNNENINSTVNSIPIYYSPKYLLGSDKVKAFVKAAVGFDYSWLKREGVGGTLTDDNFGVYLGGGAGIMVFISDKVFLNGEYEMAWSSNDYYKAGWISTAMGGIGLRF